MTSKRLSLLFATSFFLSTFCHSQIIPDVEKQLLTKWVNEEGDKIIEFINDGLEYAAVIRKAKDKALVGQKQISGLHCFNSICKDGTFYLIKRGLTFPCTVITKSAAEIEIVVKSGSTAKSQIWTKLNP